MLKATARVRETADKCGTQAHKKIVEVVLRNAPIQTKDKAKE